ncbi:UNVERIFIED_CONTAM: (13S,14R)-1,13-dihydroxy-N-methylcanadine 13-O-acetyltransferase AT1 [Sesamum radiatum]|uniref:(13S,14R)-1,13-dihydroxy-N-methylcanadine 13-O-acetyltransferase AT1 n=1 Tax=Sesamum radiatum TaxID=300843 RepID=A0AAW2PY16_SESRA
MEIKIISRENIKPSTPTPDHLRLYKISLLDQIIPPAFVPAVLYFAPGSTSVSQRTQLLKDSLALTLTHFYPLAGVIRDAFSIDCNDEGLPFFVANVKGLLSDFLDRPDVLFINRMIPGEFSWDEAAGPGSNVGTVQLNCFDCGGTAICLIFAHHVGDATTLCTFLKSWAAAANDPVQILRPDYIAQSAFPQQPSMPKESYLFYPLQKFLKIGKFVTMRYVFDASAISNLKAQSTSSNDDHSTRVEVVSAFIWKCFMAAVDEESSNDHKPFLLTHPLNLRRRAEPQFPDNSFGNFLWLAAAQCGNPSTDKDLKELVKEVKRAMGRVDKQFMKRMKSEDGYYENVEELRQGIPEEANWLAFSSWCKIGFYEVDFGWGRPVWVSGFVSGDSDTVLPNSATLVETRSGDGMEAWVILDDRYAAAFQKNEELLLCACFNPTVFIVNKIET